MAAVITIGFLDRRAASPLALATGLVEQVLPAVATGLARLEVGAAVEAQTALAGAVAARD